MKESEAKTKWCPMIRVLVTPQDATWQNSMLNNRGDIPASNQDCLCIGAACMLWQPSPGSHGDDDEPEGDCGLKTKESGCFYPG